MGLNNGLRSGVRNRVGENRQMANGKRAQKPEIGGCSPLSYDCFSGCRAPAPGHDGHRRAHPCSYYPHITQFPTAIMGPWISVRLRQDESFVEEYLDTTEAIFPSSSCPLSPIRSLVCLVGRRSKARLLAPIIGAPPAATPHRQLVYHPDQLEASNIAFIDCETHQNSTSDALASIGDGPKVGRRIQSLGTKEHDARHTASLLYGRFLTNIADVMCYFAGDFGGSRGLASFLACQMCGPQPSDLPVVVLPEILVVVDTTTSLSDETSIEVQFRQRLLQCMGNLKQYDHESAIQRDISAHCRSIRVVVIASHWNVSKQAQTIRQRILKVTAASKDLRRAHRLDFEPRHWRSLVSHMLEHLCKSKEPFSFISSSRCWGFMADQFEDHLTALLHHTPTPAWLWHFVCPLVGSAILLSLYPPQSHSK